MKMGAEGARHGAGNGEACAALAEPAHEESFLAPGGPFTAVFGIPGSDQRKRLNRLKKHRDFGV